VWKQKEKDRMIPSICAQTASTEKNQEKKKEANVKGSMPERRKEGEVEGAQEGQVAFPRSAAPSEGGEGRAGYATRMILSD